MTDDNNTLKRARFNHKWGMLSVYAMIKGIKFATPRTGYSRTPKQQNERYQQGRTKPGRIVTYCDGHVKKSKHQLDQARDIFIMDERGKPINKYGDHPHYAILGEFWENLGSKWGGNFKNFKDIFHFQL